MMEEIRLIEGQVHQRGCKAGIVVKLELVAIRPLHQVPGNGEGRSIQSRPSLGCEPCDHRDRVLTALGDLGSRVDGPASRAAGIIPRQHAQAFTWL